MTPPPLFPLPGTRHLSRRTFLTGSATFAAVALLSTRAYGVVNGRPKFSGYPFTLGIASGDPLPDGVVLWTRLAPKPLEVGGGMPPEPVEVSWQIAEDEAMTRVVQSGKATANPAWAHSVHVEVEGLKPDRWYWYQFKAGGEISPRGRTRTMPPAGSMPDRLRFAFASCQKYETGFYTAYEHMVREDLDLMFHLGDYIYEKGNEEGGARSHGQAQVFTLDEYRARYAVYKTDPALQAMHAAVPWIVTWDDHEVNNDYAGNIPETKAKMTTERFLLRRAAGYQAYFEHMPLRRTALPTGPDMLLYRRLAFGRLASFNVLDTRQYRSHGLFHDQKAAPADPGQLDPARTIMGARQRDWLFDGLDRSASAWNVLAQQVMVARPDLAAGDGTRYMMDKWPGFEFERRRLLRHLQEHQVANPVVLTGDVHQNWANELPLDPDKPGSPSVGTEFVGTSISSSGDGEATPARTNDLYAENPFVKFFNTERGYVRCEVTPKDWRSDYRTVPYVSRRNAPLQTRASFVVESGRPVLNRV
ncbi:MAG: alkaline phosphatase D family protein [Opitutaceae bacterium]|nr:alkaline phosphatase D family protein [Opitutaceae bacterium]